LSQQPAPPNPHESRPRHRPCSATDWVKNLGKYAGYPCILRARWPFSHKGEVPESSRSRSRSATAKEIRVLHAPPSGTTRDGCYLLRHSRAPPSRWCSATCTRYPVGHSTTSRMVSSSSATSTTCTFVSGQSLHWSLPIAIAGCEMSERRVTPSWDS